MQRTQRRRSRRLLLGFLVGTLVSLSVAAAIAAATPFGFSTGNPDGLMAMGSRPASLGKIEVEAADDFILPASVTITGASFVGLLPLADVALIGQVRVEVYRVFPTDSINPPSGRVPTRVNSPSDVEFVDRDSLGGTLSFQATVLNPSFTASNSVLNGINSIPNQTTGGEGPVTGAEVRFDITFNPALTLPADHYFFVPQVQLATGDFFWLSAPKPIVFPGTPFTPDLQTWIRNESLAPDWLRVGTDIVGSVTTFNGTFSLTGAFAHHHHHGAP